MTITYSEFVQTIKDHEGMELVSFAGRARFHAERTPTGVRFTLSNGELHPLTEEGVQRYLDIFNRENSFTTTDYSERMRNSTYVLGVLHLWRLNQQADKPLLEDEMIDPDMDPEFSTPEGKRMLRTHLRRERSQRLVKKAKRLFRANNQNRLFCEVCSFDFGKGYGEPDFIEAHHRIPIRDCQPGHTTKIPDLAMVCANCHRMLHRGNPWLTVEELKERRDLRVKQSKEQIIDQTPN